MRSSVRCYLPSYSICRFYLLLCIICTRKYLDVYAFTGLPSTLEVSNALDNSFHNDQTVFRSNSITYQKTKPNAGTKLFLFDPNNNEEESFLLSMVEDREVLAYDVFLIINLFVAISSFVTHRSSPLLHINEAISSGSIFAICWVFAGIYHGSFLFSSSTNPYKAGNMALTTFISTCNIRLVLELLVQSLILHQKIEFEWLEFVVGITLMAAWRWLHSVNANRY